MITSREADLAKRLRAMLRPHGLTFCHRSPIYRGRGPRAKAVNAHRAKYPWTVERIDATRMNTIGKGAILEFETIEDAARHYCLTSTTPSLPNDTKPGSK